MGHFNYSKKLNLINIIKRFNKQIKVKTPIHLSNQKLILILQIEKVIQENNNHLEV